VLFGELLNGVSSGRVRRRERLYVCAFVYIFMCCWIAREETVGCGAQKMKRQFRLL
jgi:hypothetical protein